MNILDKFIEKNIRKIIINAYKLISYPNKYSEYKKEIKKNYGVYFINFIDLKNGFKTVMVKRKSSTYIYMYKTNTDELILKGERKNVNT